MKSSATLLSLAAMAGAAAAGGVTSVIAPASAAPTGCATSLSGQFEMTVAKVKTAAKRSFAKRDTCGSDGILVMSLSDSVLTDAKNRTGYIASNYQFQFDGPPQSGAIYTAGFSVCGNSSIALGGSTSFYQCKSGGFWNLYDRNWAEQCEEVQLIAIDCGSGAAEASESVDGQVVATSVYTTTLVKTIGDGQVQAVTTTVPVALCQIGDGQVQAVTTPCASITATTTSVAPTVDTTAVVVSQYSDGQIQVTSAIAGTVTASVPAATAATTTAVAASSPAAVVSVGAGSGYNTTLITASAKGSSAVVATVATTAAGTTTAAAGATTSTVNTSGASRFISGSLAGLAVLAVAVAAF